MYSRTRTSAGQVMPLLMGCTTPSRISNHSLDIPPMYDPITQKTVIDFRTVGTKSLQTSHYIERNSAGGRVSRTDKKNEIDDQKNVK